MAKRRDTKFWRKREVEVMAKLGLEPVPGSGAGLRKEDGEGEFVLCQLKSTEGESIKVNLLDVQKLIHHADEVNKIPVFALDFIPDILMVAAPVDELGNLANYLNKGLFERKQQESFEPVAQVRKRKIKSAGIDPEKLRRDALEVEEDENEDKCEKSYFDLLLERKAQNRKGKG